MTIAEKLRAKTLQHLLSVPTLEADWETRRAKLLTSLPNQNRPTPQQLVAIGNQLAGVFQSTGTGDRSQSSLSAGGKVWEVLVLWYFNLCFAGTHAVAVSGRFIPACVKDALRVSYDNRSVKSDTDVVVLSCRALSEECGDSVSEVRLLAQVNQLVSDNFSKTGVVVMQTKTHWNDSAQTPMLWNIIYRQTRAGAIIQNGFGVGSGLWSIQNLGDFAYSFASVPSNPAALEYGADQVPVLRVKGMTGGSYWGHPSKNGVCWSLAEFFIKQFNRNGQIWPNVSSIGTGYAQSTHDTPLCDRESFKFL